MEQDTDMHIQIAEICTTRLLLRPWQAADRLPFARLNADPRVMEHFPALLTEPESHALVDRIEAHFAQHGYGLWAVERPALASFIGCIGLMIPRFEASFTPCVEVGWRLAAEHWGQGLAVEGAHAAMLYGFQTLKLQEILSFTAVGNHRSRRVMEKLGMTHDAAEDFDHPLLPEGHTLRRHVLYRMQAIRPETTL